MRRKGKFVATALLAAALTMLWLGCGVKSPPIPPEAARPEQVLDLQANSQRNGIHLEWHRPDRYAGGQQMRDLGGFTVIRAESDGPYQKIVGIPVTDQSRVRQQKLYEYLDRDTDVGKTYHYQVISNTTDGYVSKPSNTATVIRRLPPPPLNPYTYQLPTPSPIP
jgi:hypothetical protein